MILLDGIILGLGASLATGGRFRCAAQNSIRFEYLLVGGLGLQLAWPWMAASLGVGGNEFLVVWTLVAFLVLGVTAVNIRIPGMPLIAGGLLLNLAVILVNGGMPVSVAGEPTLQASAGELIARSPLHVPMLSGTRLAFLADTIYVPGPSWHRAMVSVGDLLMAAGAGMVAFWALRCRGSVGDSVPK